MLNFEYKAIRVRETKEGNWLVLFAAPATQVNTWAGVPQKKQISENDATETTGFQREVNPARLRALRDFYKDARNVIQNSLLCATRVLDEKVISFQPDKAKTNPIKLVR